MMMPTTVTTNNIVYGLRKLGVHKGEHIMVHSSLSRFGFVEGGAKTVVDALLEAIGPEGTLLAPAFTFSNNKLDDPVLDILETPSEMGAIPEAIRRRCGANRSPHLTHSVAALGPLAREYTHEHSLPPCGSGSPLWKLVQNRGSIVLLGASLNAVTAFHVIEELLNVPYVHFKDMHGLVREADGTTRPLHSQRHQCSIPYDFNPLAGDLEKRGILTRTTIGQSICRCLHTKPLSDYLTQRLKPDPLLLTLKTDEKSQIPVTVESTA